MTQPHKDALALNQIATLLQLAPALHLTRAEIVSEIRIILQAAGRLPERQQAPRWGFDS